VETVEKARSASATGDRLWRETARTVRSLEHQVLREGSLTLWRHRARLDPPALPDTPESLLGELVLTAVFDSAGLLQGVRGYPEFIRKMEDVDPRVGLTARELRLDEVQREELLWQWEALRREPITRGHAWSRTVDVNLGEVAGKRRFDLRYEVAELAPCSAGGAGLCARVRFESGPPPDVAALQRVGPDHAHGMPSGGAKAFVSIRLHGEFVVGVEDGTERCARLERQALSEARDLGLAERVQVVERTLLSSPAAETAP
jgi:hypothetical protein